MPTTLICPTCNVACAVHVDGDGVKIDYDFDEWSRRCAHPDSASMAICPSMRTVARLMLSQLIPPTLLEGDQEE